MHSLILKPGREKSLQRRHPWIFSGGIARVDGNPQAGDTVEVRTADGVPRAIAAYSPQSQIRARIWNWTPCPIDADFFAQRIAQAAARREPLRSGGVTNAVRLIHGESDGLPGVVADRYEDTVVVQLLTTGAERWREAIADALAALAGVVRVVERSDADVRQLEGLPSQTGLLRGAAATGPVMITEHGLQFAIDVVSGHKTGFYLDQRDNRQRLRALVAGNSVLDCFCYTGGFAINALAGGASAVTAIDSSGPALQAAQANAALNRLNGTEWLEADVFQSLRKFRDAGRSFDVIVLDPPKFAPTAAHAEKAARAYKDINLLAFKLLNPGGTLMTYSCSGGVSAELFQKIIAGAALDAGVDAVIEAWLHGAADHPVALNFPEGEYLKGLICRTNITTAV
ncbi:MAG: class I SAM-dependent methyltransferase [Betaproteobacteria bacterium]|jgi:23S rRNA (cytosine1962-C5)-methyltransferase|nr:class I SAM-dependent methyltransferase [Betaproteobacteria bacterium]MDH5341878.1 class I SAM-dependent methyltransferase [Betaproteobacteria bacterium]